MANQPVLGKPAPWVIRHWHEQMLHRIALATLSPVQPTAHPGVRQVTTPGR